MSYNTLNQDSVQSPSVSDLNREIREQQQGTEEKHGTENHAPSSSGSTTHTDEVEQIVITSIWAADVAKGLKRNPAYFYAVLQHSSLEWRTENRRVSVDNDLVEWGGPIPIPSDWNIAIHLRIYATFEFQPILGSGELLRELTTTMKELQDHSEEGLPFTFSKEGDVVSPCSALLVTLGRCKRDGSGPPGPRVLDPHGSTTEGRGELEDVTDEGHSALSRYQKHGEKLHLEGAIEQFQRALNICPLEHPCHAAAKSNMALAMFILCQVDSGVSFDVPLGLYRDALSARPVGHPDRPSTLLRLASAHFARFTKRRDEIDVVQAETLLREVMDLSSGDSYETRAARSVLQLRIGRKKDLAEAGTQSSVKRDSASGLTDEDPITSGVELLGRYQRSRSLDELHQAITLLEAFVNSISASDSRYLAGLTNSGVALLYRFRRLGELGDLEQAMARFSEAVKFTPDNHPGRSACLNNLGNTFRARYARLGSVSDLEQAISTFREAVDLTPEGDRNKPGRLVSLGNCLLARPERLGEPDDVEEAISTFRNAIDILPHGHPDKPVCLHALSDCFRARFARVAELSDLEQAISELRHAINLTPDGHPDKPRRLNTLCNTLFTRFEHLGELSDLEQAISILEKAIDAIPNDHPQKPACLSNLGNLFRARFERLGEISDLEQAIWKQEDAVDLTPEDHLDKPRHLNNLGSSFRARFERLGDLSDLEQAISKQRDAVDLTHRDHPDKPSFLNNLGNSFLGRFERLGELSDLEEAKSRFNDAIDLIPNGHPHKASGLNNLANTSLTRFQHLGELSDLEQAISRFRDTVDLTPDGHPEKPRRLNNLGNSLLARFERLGELGDLEEAILRQGSSVDLTPEGHPDKPAWLNNLGNALRARFQQLGEASDIEQAILKHENAANLTPDDHPDKPGCLNGLGNSLLTRFMRFGQQPRDLEQTISRFADAVDLTPDGHPNKPVFLNGLANSLLIRFEQLKELSDLEQAISKFGYAVDLTPNGHPQKPSFLYNLANSFFARFERLGELSDLEHTLSLYSAAARASTGPATTRFHASQQWISSARSSRHHTLLHAYSSAISLLPQLAWIGLSLTTRYRELVEGADVVREAAAAALDAGFPEMAVEWLEQGRSIVWGELFQLRSSYDELSVFHPDRARRLEQLSAALEYAGAVREKSLSSSSEPMQSLDQEANRHRALAIERDTLLQDIRGLPGFERFLVHKEFSQLRASAHSGPVVILNAAKSRCDALIVLTDVEDVIHVPLRNVTSPRDGGIQDMLKDLVGHVRDMPYDDREGRRYERRRVSWEFILSMLWNNVVKPVLDALAFSTPGDLSRIFWCPTGPFTFLPIHAAGLYGTQSSGPGHKVSDFVVSSYTPTLSILTPSPKPDTTSTGNLRFLTVRQPTSDGQSRLPGVEAELGHIRKVILDSPSARTTLKVSSTGTVEEVLDLMKEADWVHFACHGIQDAANPTDSGLCLADERRLRLSDIIALSRPRGGLAFLSACQTATGDEDLSDEAIHVAAGMLFVGYAGVVGTMWSISDKLAPSVTKDVYEQLFRDGAVRPDHREAARALQDAVGRLREGGASFVEWLPFIHVGL